MTDAAEVLKVKSIFGRQEDDDVDAESNVRDGNVVGRVLAEGAVAVAVVLPGNEDVSWLNENYNFMTCASLNGPKKAFKVKHKIEDFDVSIMLE